MSKMLVHICCSVDSHFFLQRLQKEYGKELVGYFYDPNIHPYSEYRLRFLDVQRSCQKLGIPLLEGPYDYESWLEAVRGLEKEPEKGARCMVCFDKRLKNAARKAKELGIQHYTTTLLVSPLKSQEQLKKSAKVVDKELGTKFIFVDYRSGGGTQEQARVTKEQQLYRQDYCGCLFGLSLQREAKNQLMDEMICPVDKQILPASIEERLTLYQKRMVLEEKGIEYTIIRKRFLNYRLLRGFVRVQKTVVPSYILSYSHLRREYAKAKIEYIHQGIGYANRDEIRVAELRWLNRLLQTNFTTTKELYFKGLDQNQQMRVRQEIDENIYSLSPIIVLDKIPQKFEIHIEATSYKDVKEELILKDG